MRHAIDEGVVSDYRVNILELSNGDKDPLLLELFKERYVEWGATLAIFNDLARAGEFAEKLCAKGIAAEIVHGCTPSALRRAVADRLESGETRVAVVVGCWNEGVDISCMNTIVFCDTRSSGTNKRQLSQRASRLHDAKPYYRIVLPIQSEVDDIAGLLQSFRDDDPCFRASAANELAQNSRRADSRLTVEHASDACLINEMLLTRLGEVLATDRPSTQQKVEWPIQISTDSNRVPGLREVVDMVFGESTDPFAVGRFLHSIEGNWTGDHAVTKLSPSHMKLIEACRPLSYRIARFKRGAPTYKQKIAWVLECGEEPSSRTEIEVPYRSVAYLFKIGIFVSNAVRRIVAERPMAADGKLQELEWFAARVKSLKTRPLERHAGVPSYDQKLQWMIEFGRPTRKGETIEKPFRDGTCTFMVGPFWSHLLERGAKDALTPRSLGIIGAHRWILEAIDARKALQSRKGAGLGTVPLDVRIDWLVAFSRKPTRVEVIEKSYGRRIGQWKIGNFWHNLQLKWMDGRCYNKGAPLSLEQKRRLASCEWVRAEFAHAS
jgi:hypothetical protein